MPELIIPRAVFISNNLAIFGSGIEADKTTIEKEGVLPTVWYSRPYRSRTCDTLIKSHGVLNQARKEVKTLIPTP